MFFSGLDNLLKLRRLQDRLIDEAVDLWSDLAEQRDTLETARADLLAQLQTVRSDLLAQLQTARDIVLALRDEVVAARGADPTLAARLAAIEARLTVLETPPAP